MARGHYHRPIGPAELEAAAAAHPLAAWGARKAIAPAAPAASAVLRLRDAGRQIASGGRTLVGAAWFHGLGDREAALAQLDMGYVLFATDVVANASEHDRAWISTDVLPLVTSWAAFEKSARGSTIALVAIDWETFERWLDKLKAARAAARTRDIALASPEPGELPETVFDQAREGHGGSLVATIGVVKLAIAGVVALAGAWGVYSVVRDWRSRARMKR